MRYWLAKNENNYAIGEGDTELLITKGITVADQAFAYRVTGLLNLDDYKQQRKKARRALNLAAQSNYKKKKEQ